ncbi:hypothetical protein G7Z17_g12966 [Cylindrodendrum hubeiense]|uniref:Uncharacterized protein n=1 Tax=Cylindrodendrum hubeiense TaxID=595255 RepID=A0A9P5L8Q6_9HYPO|nr:hypothetical protein G7Z17_g12966 [Cylindrodendrum hubeiense]
MRSFIFLVFVSVTLSSSLCAAWVFPRHLPDGVYHITLPDEDNSETKPIIKRAYRFKDEQLLPNGPPEYLPDLAPPVLPVQDIPGDYGKVPLDVLDWDCIYSEPPYDLADYQIARANLMSFCNRWVVPRRMAHISAARRGEVVVYVCNYKQKRQSCSGREYKWAETHYFNSCGDTTPGWVFLKGDKAYGRGWIGEELCDLKIGRDNPHVNQVVWAGRPPEWGAHKDRPKFHKNVDKYINWMPEANGHTSPTENFRAEWEFPDPDGRPDHEVEIIQKIEEQYKGDPYNQEIRPYDPMSEQKDKLDKEKADKEGAEEEMAEEWVDYEEMKIAMEEAAQKEAAKKEAAKGEPAKEEPAKEEPAKEEPAKEVDDLVDYEAMEAAKENAAKEDAAKKIEDLVDYQEKKAAMEEAAKKEAAKKEASREGGGEDEGCDGGGG